MSYNGSTGNPYSALNLLVTSEWLELTEVSRDQFDTGSVVGSAIELTHTTLSQNQVVIANVSGKVKSNIGPLARLELNLVLNGKDDQSDSIVNDTFVSSPTIFSVFPAVNITGLSDGRKSALYFLLFNEWVTIVIWLKFVMGDVL